MTSELSSPPSAAPAPRPVDSWLSATERGLNNGNFYETVDRLFTVFEVQIAECTEEAYRQAFTCADAARQKNVVYLFRAERKVNRLVGASDILYIGQTKSSFQRRYAQWAAKISGLKRNSHAHELYGPVRLLACDYRLFGESLLAAENQLLWWYYANHFEYPPFNYTRAKDPSKVKPKTRPHVSPQEVL